MRTALFCLFHLVVVAVGYPALPAFWSELGIDPDTKVPYVPIKPFEASGGSCDVGSRQSPVDIRNCLDIAGPVSLQFKGHSDFRPSGFKMINTGHTAQISYNGAPAVLSGGPLLEQYTFLQMHFHWGSTDPEGSEHAVNGKYGSLEAHFVHFKTAYHNLSEAVHYPDGVAVVGVIFDLSEEANEDIAEIIAGLEQITHYQNSVELTPSAMEWFHSFQTHYKYYTYAGSLTTTPCAEVVTWIVLEKHATISSEQLAKFRQLLIPNGVTPILEYRRHLQSINRREIVCPKRRN